jgi:Copper transport outer membrane protein, MctB
VGYSARYHASSLIAVFLALAIGILIGAEFGGDALTSTRKNIEHSLTGNLQDERERADELSGELGRADEFAERVYPVLVRRQLQGRRIGVIALGDLPGNTSNAIEDALGPTGAKLVGVGVVREPLDLHSLAGDLAKTRFADIRRNPETLTEFGTGVGRQVVRGGTLLERVRSHLFSRASGNFGGLDGVIVVRQQPEEMGPVQRGNAARLEAALLSGITGTRTPAVGVEVTSTEPSSVSFFHGNDLSSVDDVDMTAGRVAAVFALLGAEGSFGVKGSADRLLPDLLAPAETSVAPARTAKP